MCGIVGFQLFNKSESNPGELLHELTNLLTHRGPDTKGYWKSKIDKLYLGHTRLSIIDLSDEGSQPMESFDKRYVIVFNGEIYNYESLKIKLSTNKSKLKNVSDTRILLELISQYGLKKTLSLIEGMFAFMLWDKKEKTISLARDIYGEKPLFYYCEDDYFIFSSELKCIKKLLKSKLKINDESMQLYSSLGYIPAPLTIFKKVNKVLPGELLTFYNSNLSEKFKFNEFKNLNQNDDFSLNDLYYQTSELIDKSVKKMMVADVEIGCFLSGGIDSSLITSIMQKNSAKKIKTFSIGFKEKQYDESRFAKKIAEYLKTDHHELILSSNDLLDNIEKVSSIYDEPFGDSSFLPTYLLSKFASESVKVVLSGDGGDETFLGYNRYLFAKRIRMFNHYSPLLIRNILKSLLNILPIGMYDYVSNPFQKIFGIHGFSSKIQKIITLMNFEDNCDFYKKLNIIDNSRLDFLSDYNIFNNILDIVKATQMNDVNYYLSNDILVKVDRASMANSLEVRSPFLDRKLSQKVFQLPSKLTMKNHELKYLLKRKLADYIPRKYFDRPKMGFAIPLHNWFKEPKSKKYFDEIFYDSKWEKLGIEKKKIVNMWNGYIKFSNSTPTQIWNYAMAAVWLRNN